jgi:hypothetical protein
MDIQRKLELMKKYHFQGFGNRVGALQAWYTFCASENTSRESQEENIEGLYRNLKQMQDSYATINFGELESEMDKRDSEDFATLFRTREALPKLKKAIDDFVAFVRSHEYKVSRDEIVYCQLGEAISQIVQADAHKGVRYRARIQYLESLLKASQPECN